jgi:abhydrolase domain-containing protein 6
MAVETTRLSDLGRWLHLPFYDTPSDGGGGGGGGDGWWKSVFRPPSSSSTSSWIRLTTTVAAAILGTAVSTTWFLYQFRPKVLVQAFISFGRRSSGFVSRTIRGSEGFVFSFAERGRRRKRGRHDGGGGSGGGEQPIVILVPGLAGSIDNWVPVVKYMKKDDYMVAVELPGGGMTSCNPDTDLNVMAQVERLRQLIHLLGFDGEALHLVGAALGGTIVGCYAAIYPENIAKLTLICPAIRSAETGEVVKMELAGVDSGMIFRSPEAIPKSLALLTTKQIKVNKQIAKGIFEIKKDNLTNARKLGDSMLDDIWKGREDKLLTPRLSRIRAPTQVIWGQYDRVVHVSGVDVLRVGLKNCSSIDIIPCGHSIYMDEPKKTRRTHRTIHQQRLNDNDDENNPKKGTFERQMDLFNYMSCEIHRVSLSLH